MNIKNKEDEKYMRLALALAAKGLGRTSPNPCVGAVIVKNKRIIGKGWHKKRGQAHAEVNALNSATQDASGATLYVNLEPCSHLNKLTPPCTQAIIRAGIKRVVIAQNDPNPQVNGVEELKKHGIGVKTGVLEKEAIELNKAFTKAITKSLPYVLIKTAMSADGKIACNTGESRGLSSPEALEFVHKLRNEYDCILVGIGTVLQDDPRLTCRMPGGRNPLRVILDSRLSIPLNARVLADQNVVIACTSAASKVKKKALQKKGIAVEEFGKKQVNLRQLLKWLAARGKNSVLVEGGSEVNASFLEEKLVDEIMLVIAPKLIGGEKAKGAFGGIGINRINNAIPLERGSVKQIGSDFVLTAYPVFQR